MVYQHAWINIFRMFSYLRELDSPLNHGQKVKCKQLWSNDTHITSLNEYHLCSNSAYINIKHMLIKHKLHIYHILASYHYV